MSFLSRMQAVADRLIPQFGFPSKVRRISGGAVDPITGENTQATAEYDVYAAVVSISSTQILSTTIEAGDRFYLITNVQEPRNGDLFLVGSEYWHIVKSWITQAKDGHVMYKIQVRR